MLRCLWQLSVSYQQVACVATTVSFNPLDLPDAVSVWSLSNRDAGNLAA
jgi:hypothetical protein